MGGGRRRQARRWLFCAVKKRPIGHIATARRVTHPAVFSTVICHYVSVPSRPLSCDLQRRFRVSDQGIGIVAADTMRCEYRRCGLEVVDDVHHGSSLASGSAALL